MLASFRRAVGVLAGGIALALPCGLAAPAGTAYAQDSEQGNGKQRFEIVDSRIIESSGLATSTVHPDTYYTINDSGSGSMVYALGSEGQVAAALELGLVDPFDWEAVAPGPDERIWIGDIGDNERIRDTITLFRFIEPPTLSDQSVRWSRFQYTYPDGVHDAEALLVHPTTGQPVIVTKQIGGGAIYTGTTEPASGGLEQLTRLADAPSLVTDGAFLPDGSAIVLRSYSQAYVLSWPDAELQRTIDLPKQKQGESLAMHPDGKHILVGSEGQNQPVYEVSLSAKSSSQSGKPDDKPSKQPKPKPEEKDETAEPEAAVRGMPWWVPTMMVLIAVVAGLAALPRSRRRRQDNQRDRPDSRRPDDRGPRPPRPPGSGAPSGHRRSMR